MPWWLQIENKSRQGKRQGQAAKQPDPPSPGNAMSAKTPPKKAKPKKSRTGPPLAQAASAISIAMQNLINMVVVSTVSGAVLLGLLAVKHF
jgi:hypothetical protein